VHLVGFIIRIRTDRNCLTAVGRPGIGNVEIRGTNIGINSWHMPPSGP
jgi:hypothetical protein